MSSIHDETVIDEAARQKFEEIAYKQGRRDADVDARLLSHERDLLRHDKAIEKLDERLDGIDGKLDEVINAVTADKAVDNDRDARSKRELTRAQTWAVCIGIPTAVAVPILSAFIAAGKLF